MASPWKELGILADAVGSLFQVITNPGYFETDHIIYSWISNALSFDIFESKADFLLHAVLAHSTNSVALKSEYAAQLSLTLEELARRSEETLEDYRGVNFSLEQKGADILRMVESAEQNLLYTGLKITKQCIVLSLLTSQLLYEIKKRGIFCSALRLSIAVKRLKDDLCVYVLILNHLQAEPSSTGDFTRGFEGRASAPLWKIARQIRQAIEEKERTHQSLSIGLDGGYIDDKNQPDPDQNDQDPTQDPEDGQEQSRGYQAFGGAVLLSKK